MNGNQAEFYAKLILRFKGYKIIESNYKTGKGTGAGEIDIIATKRNVIAFIEVKKRQNITKALYAISSGQKARICNGIKAFLKYNKQYNKHEKRIDAFVVASVFDFVHIKNAWSF